MDDPEEEEVMRKELEWLLDSQVHQVLLDVKHVLLESCRRFPHKPGLDENRNLVTPQRLLLTSVNGNSGQVKCVITMIGDSICDGDISFKHKQGKDHHVFRTSIANRHWKLQQVQDAGNFLFSALDLLQNHSEHTKYTSAKEVLILLDTIIDHINQGRSCLAYPKRKSIEELVNNSNMQSLYPQVPNDIALSFYIHASKLVLSVYQLNMGSGGSSHKSDITARQQVECTVSWLNECVMLLTMALQHCQQLKDKVQILQQFESSENTRL